MISNDLVVRQVLMASLLYYGLDESMFPDSEFDSRCVHLARNFDTLSKQHQWQLGSADAISTSGFKVKVSLMTACAAASWLQEVRGVKVLPVLSPAKDWEFTKRFQFQWLPASDFVRNY